MRYKVLVENRDYQKWTLHDPLTFEQLFSSGDECAQAQRPELPQKYFNKDIFEVDVGCGGGAPPHIIHSPVRESQYIAGILVLEGNKTYGRTPNKKRLLYRCIPDEKRLPVFLIPYDVKPGFSKKLRNKYVLFRYDHWDDKHPCGVLTQTLGDVDQLDAFYEYQLYRKSLQVSMTDFLTRVKQAIGSCGGGGGIPMHSAMEAENTMMIEDDIRHNSNFMIEDRTQTHRVITIDNPNTVDFDDAISITEGADADAAATTVTLYITNVVFVLETLNLWKSLTNRVSTIYLPDRRRPMLPSLLSDNLCSLREGERRFAVACDIRITQTAATGEWAIHDVSFAAAIICVEKNYTYDNVAGDRCYEKIRHITQALDKMSTAAQSNDVVAFWMIQTNILCAEKMSEAGRGIYRAVTTNAGAVADADAAPPLRSENLPDTLDDETKRVIRAWNHTNGQYIPFSKLAPHEIINRNYVHITSPIRRLVDLLNQMIFLENLGIVRELGSAAKEFLEKWMGELDYINTTMRAIKKIQTDCFLLQRCAEDPAVLSEEYDGVVFDKLEKSDGGICTFMVYLKKMRLMSRVSVLNGSPESKLECYDCARFKIFLFEDKDTFRRKIKVAFAAASHAT